MNHPPREPHPPSFRRPCACRDCTIETLEGICQRCRASGCSAQGDADCKAPNAYALSARSRRALDAGIASAQRGEIAPFGDFTRYTTGDDE